MQRLENMAVIRDPVHGNVELSEFELSLLDAPQFQRLRRIRQLAMAHLVYPGANHTRFEHSIGTLCLAGRMAGALSLGREEAALARASALLHDIGHVAFSHESEAVLSRFIGDHEKIGASMLSRGEIGDILKSRFKRGSVGNFILGPKHEIISSDIGADRMDYLLRDSHYTGVAYGIIDSDRICATLSISRQGLAIDEGGLEAAESLLVARFAMFSTVYLHKTVRIASRMLQQALLLAIEEGDFDPRQALLLGDSDLLYELSKSKAAFGYIDRIGKRRLYKKAGEIGLASLGKAKAEEIESELSGTCGCDVLIDVPRLTAETHVKVRTAGGLVPLSKKSELVASLVSMQKSRLNALVMCEAKNVKKVSAACRRFA